MSMFIYLLTNILFIVLILLRLNKRIKDNKCKKFRNSFKLIKGKDMNSDDLLKRMIGKKCDYGIIERTHLAQNRACIVVFVKESYAPAILDIEEALEIGEIK